MQNYFADLLEFFGISGTPQTFAELVPWLFAVLVAIGIVKGWSAAERKKFTDLPARRLVKL